jgi:hypothetical protein
MIITSMHWYQVPTVLKAMTDRLVCAEGGIRLRARAMARSQTKQRRSLSAWLTDMALISAGCTGKADGCSDIGALCDIPWGA